MKRRIVINGKFLRAPPTGVHRVAAELANALADLQSAGHPSVAGLDISLCLPKDADVRARDIALPRRIINVLTGIPWEQLTLPLVERTALLLNLCNIGPAVSRRSVTMIHDVQVHLSPASYSRPFRLWYRFIQPMIARRHRLILTVSEFSRQEIARLGWCAPTKIVVIHNGVDHILRDPPEPDIAVRFGVVPHRYVMALSTTQAHKNIQVLLKAFARPELSAITLMLIGSTSAQDFAAAGIAVPPNVRFTGRISDGAMRGLFEQALCIAFPSTTEGFGLPPLEAMLLGCPALVAPCGALPEICGDGALYIDSQDDEAWARMIAHLSASPAERTALSVAGKQQAMKFTWQSAAILLANTLSEAVRTETG